MSHTDLPITDVTTARPAGAAAESSGDAPAEGLPRPAAPAPRRAEHPFLRAYEMSQGAHPVGDRRQARHGPNIATPPAVEASAAHSEKIAGVAQVPARPRLPRTTLLAGVVALALATGSAVLLWQQLRAGGPAIESPILAASETALDEAAQVSALPPQPKAEAAPLPTTPALAPEIAAVPAAPLPTISPPAIPPPAAAPLEVSPPEVSPPSATLAELPVAAKIETAPVSPPPTPITPADAPPESPPVSLSPDTPGAPRIVATLKPDVPPATALEPAAKPASKPSAAKPAPKPLPSGSGATSPSKADANGQAGGGTVGNKK